MVALLEAVALGMEEKERVFVKIRFMILKWIFDRATCGS